MNFIDIASHQEGIDLAELFARNPLDGVIVKATGGAGYTNPHFEKWAEWLNKNGKPFGFYHFCRELGCGGTPATEARHFYDAVYEYIGKAVLFADFERDGSDALEQGTGWLLEFLEEFRRLSGVRPLVYCSQSVTQGYDFSKIAPKYKLWLAQYANMEPVYGFQTNPWHGGSISPFQSFVMQQYTCRGKLNGWSGELDFDIYFGSFSSWLELTRKDETDPPEGLKPADPVVVSEVLAGRYGTGAERIQKLREAGYDPADVQDMINTLYGVALSCRKFVVGYDDYLNSIVKIIRILL